MSAGFKWWNYLENDYLNHNPHVIAAGLSVAVLLLGSAVYRSQVPTGDLKSAPDDAFVPPPKFGVRNLFEIFGDFVQTNANEIIGHHGKDYLPLLMWIFFFILTSNLLGSIPGFASATDNMNTTMGIGFISFLYYNMLGFKRNGLHYLEQFTGHVKGLLLLILGPVLFVLETISHFIRPVTLGVRLRTNISADHEVFHVISKLTAGAIDALHAKLGAFGTFLGYVFASVGPIPIMILGIMVALIQAIVFTLLTMVYIGVATAHEEH
jgi:F-type H+-transporting ATPase subunit a